MTNTKTRSSSRTQYTLQTLVLLTALAAVAFVAYSKHMQSLRLSDEIATLRNLIELERKREEHRAVYGERHPLTVRLAKQIKEIETEISRDKSE